MRYKDFVGACMAARDAGREIEEIRATKPEELKADLGYSAGHASSLTNPITGKPVAIIWVDEFSQAADVVFFTPQVEQEEQTSDGHEDVSTGEDPA